MFMRPVGGLQETGLRWHATCNRRRRRLCSHRFPHPVSGIPCFPAWRPLWASPSCCMRSRGQLPTGSAGALVPGMTVSSPEVSVCVCDAQSFQRGMAFAIIHHFYYRSVHTAATFYISGQWDLPSLSARQQDDARSTHRYRAGPCRCACGRDTLCHSTRPGTKWKGILADADVGCDGEGLADGDGEGEGLSRGPADGKRVRMQLWTPTAVLSSGRPTHMGGGERKHVS